MGALPPPLNPGVTGQVTLASRPSQTQSVLREMVGEVSNWNLEASDLLIRKWLNNAYREVIDKRCWYGMMVRGELNVPALYNTGLATISNGVDQVLGAGTVWTPAMVGRQMRFGMTEPIATIKSVEDDTHLTLELPWGGYDHASTAYRIFQCYVSLGPNIKTVRIMLNLRQRWAMRLHMPQEVLAVFDPQRSRVQQPRVLLDFVPSSAGEPLFEMWPPPYVQQSFPFLASIQPPDLEDDDSYPAAFIPTDLLVKKAISEALVHGGRKSPAYDPAESARKEKQFYMRLADLELKDDELYMKNLRWDYGAFPLATLPWEGSGDGASQDSAGS